MPHTAEDIMQDMQDKALAGTGFSYYEAPSLPSIACSRSNAGKITWREKYGVGGRRISKKEALVHLRAIAAVQAIYEDL